MIRRHHYSLAILLLATACAPHIDPPAPLPAPPADWSVSQDRSQEPVVMDWWTQLQDPQLDALVAKALAHNAELRAVTANLRAAQALVQEARAAKLPIGTVDGSFQRSRTAGATLQLDSFGGPAVLPSQTVADIGTSLAWELDLFGRLQGLSDQARAEAGRALWAKRGVEASVAAAVVRAWADLASADRQLALLDRREPLLRDLVNRIEQAHRLGGVRRDGVEDARAQLSALLTTRPTVEAGRRNALRRLATLTGTAAPEGVTTLASLKPDALTIPAYVRAGDPSQILRMRPDVAAAELALAKAMAQVDVSRADLYPRISIGGSLGLSAPPDRLDEKGALRFGIGPSFSWAIFDMDRVRSRIRAAGAQAQAAGATWEDVFLKALEETDAALDGFAASRQKMKNMLDIAQAKEQTAKLSSARLAAGQDSILQATQAQELALGAQSDAESARNTALSSWISAQIALGAGWRMEEPQK